MKLIARYFTLLVFVLSAVVALQANPARTYSLNGDGWRLSYWQQPADPVLSPAQMKGVKPQTIQACVPGNVELDLLRAGLIKDPMIGSNVNELRPWEGMQWCYTRTIEIPQKKEGETYELYFGGIDCLAEIWLDNQHIGSTDNMLISHTFDITPFVRAGKKYTLRVILRSALLEGENHLLGPISIGNFPAEESIYNRKAPHMFGWDIMPRLVSAGLWRNVELRIQPETRLRDAHYMTAGINGGNATIYLNIQVKMPMERYDHTMAHVVLTKDGKTACDVTWRIYTPALRITFGVGNCELWWPKGYGDAALYEAKLTLEDEKSGEVLDTDTRKLGIRTTRLERNDINLPPDNPGKFKFYVNDVPIFVRGTNWVPVDALHSRDEGLTRDAMQMAADLNCNMIRCWGGNVYESDLFYNLCDSLGIMVWQDFCMGCTQYPQRNDFADRLEQEAIQVVMRLRNHPSLVLWAGNNEDDSASHWGNAPFNINPEKDRTSREVLPRVIYEFDPTRPYLPSSPYISQQLYEMGCREEMMPEAHLWGPRGYYKDAYYKQGTNCFVSEIGYHGCPSLAGLKKMMTPECVYPWTHDFQWNDEWLTKSVRRFKELGQTNERNDLMLNQIRIVFGDVPTKLEDFIFASQSVQAEAMKFFVELWRGHKFANRNGIIWWNLRDGWPLISDAVTDYYNNKKLAYYYIQNVQRDVCCMICDAEEGYDLIVTNDTQHPSKGNVKVTDIATGRTIYEGAYAVEANARTVVTHLPQQEGQGMMYIEYDVDGVKSGNHYLYGTPPFKLQDYRELIQKTNLYSSHL